MPEYYGDWPFSPKVGQMHPNSDTSSWLNPPKNSYSGCALWGVTARQTYSSSTSPVEHCNHHWIIYRMMIIKYIQLYTSNRNDMPFKITLTCNNANSKTPTPRHCKKAHPLSFVRIWPSLPKNQELGINQCWGIEGTCKRNLTITRRGQAEHTYIGIAIVAP